MRLYSNNILEKAYDTYSPIVYGIALKLTASEKDAGIILISTFLKLARQELLHKNETALCATLIKLTIQTAREEKGDSLIKERLPLFKAYPLLYKTLCGQVAFAAGSINKADASRKILIVDDDDVMLNVVTVILEARGYDAVTLNTADNLLQNIDELKPGLLLLDIHLGKHDGRALCKEIKTTEAYKHLPVILFSVRRPNSEDKSSNDLCDEFIEKPLNVNNFISSINKYLN